MQGVLTLIRTDAGTENVEIHVIQVALRQGHRDSMSGYRSVSIGRSTSNQRIEIITSTQVPRFRKWRQESVAHVTYLTLAGGQQH